MALYGWVYLSHDILRVLLMGKGRCLSVSSSDLTPTLETQTPMPVPVSALGVAPGRGRLSDDVS